MKCKLVFTDGNEFELGSGQYDVGRDLSNAIVLNDDSVSRYHARILVEQGRVRIFDRNSTNGTFVNGNRIKGAVLKNGDDIGFGGKAQVPFTVNY